MSKSNLEILAYDPSPLGLLCLRRRELLSDPGTIVTEVTLNHEFLMSSLITDSERALANLERVVELRPPFGSFNLLWIPMYEPMLDDSRFQALLDKSGLAGRRPIRAPIEESP